MQQDNHSRKRVTGDQAKRICAAHKTKGEAAKKEMSQTYNKSKGRSSIHYRLPPDNRLMVLGRKGKQCATTCPVNSLSIQDAARRSQNKENCREKVATVCGLKTHRGGGGAGGCENRGKRNREIASGRKKKDKNSDRKKNKNSEAKKKTSNQPLTEISAS